MRSGPWIITTPSGDPGPSPQPTVREMSGTRGMTWVLGTVGQARAILGVGMPAVQVLSPALVADMIIYQCAVILYDLLLDTSFTTNTHLILLDFCFHSLIL